LNHWRKKKFIATVSIEEVPYESEESETFDPVREAVKTDDTERLISIIRSLPEEQRKALILRFVDELSHAEIAELLGRTEGSARVLLHRTVSDIRRRIS
ncbi:MAG: RNA polymerase sigma factor, partial [Acidimicrobiia bacterium]